MPCSHLLTLDRHITFQRLGLPRDVAPKKLNVTGASHSNLNASFLLINTGILGHLTLCQSMRLATWT